MEEKGFSFDAILKYYYTGIKISKSESLKFEKISARYYVLNE
jgi:hypothetical protein